jgi:hypothetical protein
MDKKSHGRAIPSGNQIGIYARREYDGCFWLKSKEGWIQEHMGSNINEKSLVIPKYVGQPKHARILSTSFKDAKGNEPRDKQDTVLFTAVFKIEIMYPDNQIIKISRTFDEINAIQKALLYYGDTNTINKIKSLNFYSDTEIDDELMEDVNTFDRHYEKRRFDLIQKGVNPHEIVKAMMHAYDVAIHEDENMYSKYIDDQKITETAPPTTTPSASTLKPTTVNPTDSNTSTTVGTGPTITPGTTTLPTKPNPIPNTSISPVSTTETLPLVPEGDPKPNQSEIGRASCRERV